MSLLDGLILDGALNPPVVKQEIWLAIRTDGATGAGTEDDPYNCTGRDSDADPKFDQIMRLIVSNYPFNPLPTTIRLQPGTYYTKGFGSAQSAGEGWTAAAGMRMVGSGI